MEYQVELESFRGPLDLLLYLVKHNEVDICDIPIARIAEQFLEHLRVLQMIDVERRDFLVMAATLMEIKSKPFAAQRRDPEEEADPRLEPCGNSSNTSSSRTPRPCSSARRWRVYHLRGCHRRTCDQRAVPAAACARALGSCQCFRSLDARNTGPTTQTDRGDETPIHVYMERSRALNNSRTRLCGPVHPTPLP